MLKVGKDAYRLEFVQVRPGWLWDGLNRARQDGALSHFAFGEYDILTLRPAPAVAEALNSPGFHEEALSIHIMPLFTWDVGASGVVLCPDEAPGILGVFALKISPPWPENPDTTPAKARSSLSTVAGVVEQLVVAVNGPHVAICGGIGFFDVVVLLQTDRVSDVEKALQRIHGISCPEGTKEAVLSVVSPVVAVRAEAGTTEKGRVVRVGLDPSDEGELSAHVCLGYRPGKFQEALEAARRHTGDSVPELQVARYDVEVVARDRRLSDIAQMSLKLQNNEESAFCEVRTALSFFQN